jgi:2-iminobutanoate/2-iminopropanoate deaminase
MMRKEVRADELPVPVGHYSDAVRLDNLLFLSGCMPVDADGSLVAEGDPVEQARCVFRNMGHVLRAAGSDYEHVAKLTIYLADMSDARHMSPVRREFFGEIRPASTLLQVASLAIPGMRLEVDAIAGIPRQEEWE